MRHRRPPADDEGDEEEELPPRRRRSSRRSADREPVRRWSPDPEDEEDDGSEEEEDEDSAPGPRVGYGLFHRGKEPVYFRARDSVFFEPLVALAIIVVLLVGLFAFTQNWPPMYVVESNSMQHGFSDQVGLINTGDLVLAQKVSSASVVTYFTGLQRGYTTYGEYGDVLLYYPGGASGGVPIIHRALLSVTVNADRSVSIPELAGQPCGAAADAVYRVSSTANGCGTNHIGGSLTLLHVGWRSATVYVPLAALGSSSGFLTMGDNNFDPQNTSIADPDQPSLALLVQSGWIVGVARGMLPWFGSIKLLLEGSSAEVPVQSWEWIGVTVVSLLLIAFGIHYFLRAEGYEDERRKEEDDARREEEGESRRDRSHRWLHPIRAWRERDEDDEEPPRRHRGTHRPKRSWWGGRPKPVVGRRAAHSHRRHPTEDDDL